MQIFLSVAIFVFIVSSKIYRLGRKLVGNYTLYSRVAARSGGYGR